MHRHKDNKEGPRQQQNNISSKNYSIFGHNHKTVGCTIHNDDQREKPNKAERNKQKIHKSFKIGKKKPSEIFVRPTDNTD